MNTAVEEEVSYYEKLEKKAQALTGNEQKLALCILKIVQTVYYKRQEHQDEVIAILNAIAGHADETIVNTVTRAVKKLMGTQSNDSFDKRMTNALSKVVRQLLGNHPADIAEHMMTHAIEYSYSVGYYRKPFRTTDIQCHIEEILTKIYSLIELYQQKKDFALMDYLTKVDYDIDTSIIASHIAFALDNNNEEVFLALKEIIYGENNTALLSRTMIKGIFLSHNVAAHQMMGELLIAAKLQEGLRQSIVESMDEGNLAATTYILKIIIDQDLIRYSSVLRALEVWTGLSFEATNSRVTKQTITYAYQCLTDETLRNQYLESEDVNKLFMSLWASAVREEQDLYSKVENIMEHGALYQKIVAQYLLTQSQNKELRYMIAQKYLAETDLELRYYVLENYTYQCQYPWGIVPETGEPNTTITIERLTHLEKKAERIRQFELLKQMIVNMPKKELSFPSKVYDWLTISYSVDVVVKKMLYLIAYDMDSDAISEIIALKDRLSPDVRGNLLKYFIRDDASTIQREFLFVSLSDKSIANREIALEKIKKLILQADEVNLIEAMLNLKTGSLRQGTIKILLGLPQEEVVSTINRLLKSKNELQRLGALELLNEIKNDTAFAEPYALIKKNLLELKEPTKKEAILISKLCQAEEYSAKNGFGLYAVTGEARVKEPQQYEKFNIKEIFTLSTEKMNTVLQELSSLVHEHREHEYEVEWYSGYKQTYLIGERLETSYNRRVTKSGNGYIKALPLPEVWSDYLQKSGLSVLDILQLAFYCKTEKLYQYCFHKLSAWEQERYQPKEGWTKELIKQIYPLEQIKVFFEQREQTAPSASRSVGPTIPLPYSYQISTLIDGYFEDADKKTRFTLANKVLNTIVYSLPVDKLEMEKELLHLIIYPWLNWLEHSVYDDGSFEQYFCIKYKLYTMKNLEDYIPSLIEFIRAYDLQLVTSDEIFKELLIRKECVSHIRSITNKKENLVQEYPSIKKFKEQVIAKILEVELKRGDLPTEVSALAMGISYYEGMEYFVNILLALENETFIRGYIYSYGNNSTKRECLSSLLRACYPKEGENEHLLRELLTGKNITEKNLLEAAMYAPQWIEIVANYLKWTGLRSAAWYFHAHINESFSAEKETIVAHYSAISAEDFNDGAFDIQWFRDAYGQLGEIRFNVLYSCAKYISAGANHRRSQLFADATLGNLELQDMQTSVAEKRNKDHLLCYTLIPLNTKDPKDVLKRYGFIQEFLKESKKFGAQRRASEGKVASIALHNLARNAGYKDVIRLTWDMESEKIKEIMHYLEPYRIDDMTVQLVIDEEGSGSIKVVKNDKILKSIPAKYNKHEYIVALKESNSEIKDQYRRAKAELERSMEAQSTFSLHEIENLTKNPVLAPMIHKVVLQIGKHLGYFKAGTLTGVDGVVYQIEKHDEISIAHPIALYESEQWSLYQQDLFERGIKQPFKQVFRELYLPNEDELASGIVSRRYAGHQVQPKKTVALLKTRAWTVNYEEGLQKVYYKENIIAKIYALADWFSPSDVESPTLETVQFLDRHTYKSLEIKAIPQIIFSEIMRDVDLVVSVAHVGGVDPEASLSTIDMRKSIALASLRLMKIQNVRLEGNYAHIAGSLGEYSVHLGSGMVYKQATGSIYIIPVHSQHRGRIFLPFIDEDPKTAEIISKIVLLSEDKKIKDPHILEQIKG